MTRLFSAVFASATVLLLTHTPAAAQNAKLAKPQQPTAMFAHKSVDQAWKAAVTGRKPLLVMFTSDHCVYCKKMLKETYGHPAIQQMLIGNAETVLAHANQYRDLAKKLGIRGYPTTMLVSPEGKVLDFVPGFVEPKEFAQRIHPLLKGPQKEATNASVAINR